MTDNADPNFPALYFDMRGTMTNTEIAEALGVQRDSLMTRLRRRGITPIPDPPRPLKGHGTRAAYRRGCRCRNCIDANNNGWKAGRLDRAARIAAGTAPDTLRHGESAYTNWGCRCQICVDAHKDRAATNYRARKNRNRAEVPHGTVSGYSGWGCRCARCKKAKSDYTKAHP